ncbi:Formate dehydrogenase, nitrate-inducible, major subunit precursor [Serratia fonticola]|uniref:Formate dehydrogenase, nitrate-inducible, major subunit n=1 Tax=Serratia fonticola TaxID=47917 RepID=A0A4U9TGR3_SERFO|nr:Formate dehydrogenase, nitrate-inducible, major subunit precursor [Serratia fonticola]
MVTRRLQNLKVNGQDVDTIGIPLHWGFEGAARKGYLANTLDAVCRRCQLANAGIQGVSG